MPYTVSFVIRKRQQIDAYGELPKDKRPPEKMIWEGTAEEIESWIDKVFDRKSEPNATLMISETEIEG